MKEIVRILTGAGIVAVLGVAAWPALAQNVLPPSSPAPAPGPIVGAGLPVLAVGYAVYWLAKRRRKAE